MKPVASLILAAALCACSAQPEGDATPATVAAPHAPSASAAATGRTGAPDGVPAAPASEGAATNPAPPAGAQGIAVGEPNPAAPGGFQPPASGPGSGLARYDGYGDLRFGMDEAAVRKAWGGELEGEVHGDACGYLKPHGARPMSDFAFMFEGGKLVRYDVGNDREVAPGGGRRGMTRADIERLYPGRVQAAPHHYVEGGRYLKVRGDGGVLVFETDAHGVVTEWRAGVEPQVNYIEGCS